MLWYDFGFANMFLSAMFDVYVCHKDKWVPATDYYMFYLILPSPLRATFWRSFTASYFYFIFLNVKCIFMNKNVYTLPYENTWVSVAWRSVTATYTVHRI